MSVTYTEMKEPVLQSSSRKYSTTLTNADGTPVLAAQVSEVLAWVVDEDEEVINGRNGVSVKNSAGGTLTDGEFTFQLSALDTALQPADVSNVQVRYLHLEFQMVGGLVHRHEVLWYVAADHRPA